MKSKLDKAESCNMRPTLSKKCYPKILSRKNACDPFVGGTFPILIFHKSHRLFLIPYNLLNILLCTPHCGLWFCNKKNNKSQNELCGKLPLHLAQHSSAFLVTSWQSKDGQVSDSHIISPWVQVQETHGCGVQVSPSLRFAAQWIRGIGAEVNK